jgi:signal transduction histidine kinase
MANALPDSSPPEMFRETNLGQTLFDISERGLAVLSSDGEPMLMNAAARRDFCFGESGPGGDAASGWPGAVGQEARQALRTALQRAPATSDLAIGTDSGFPRRLVIELRPLSDRHGNVVAALAAWPNARPGPGAEASDKIEQLEAEISAASDREGAMQTALTRLQALGEFVVTVSHDLNNILSSGSSALRILGRSSKGRRDADVVERGIETLGRGARLVRQMLDLARGFDELPAPTSILDISGRLEPLARALAGARIQLSFELAPDVWATMMVASRLESVLLNLVADARDAMADGGSLVIRARNLAPDACPPSLTPGDYVRLDLVGTEEGGAPAGEGGARPLAAASRKRGFGLGSGLSSAAQFADEVGGRCFVAGEPLRAFPVSLYLPRALPEPTSTRGPGDAL